MGPRPEEPNIRISFHFSTAHENDPYRRSLAPFQAEDRDHFTENTHIDIFHRSSANRQDNCSPTGRPDLARLLCKYYESRPTMASLRYYIAISGPATIKGQVLLPLSPSSLLLSPFDSS